MIEVSSLHKKYGSFLAIQNVSFSIPAGKIVGLLGPNGAGKTTIMKTLTGFHYADQGTVFINGFDMITDPIKAKRSIGATSQKMHLATQNFK